MEMMDCAMPLVRGVVPTADPVEGFRDVDAAFLGIFHGFMYSALQQRRA